MKVNILLLAILSLIPALFVVFSPRLAENSLFIQTYASLSILFVVIIIIYIFTRALKSSKFTISDALVLILIIAAHIIISIFTLKKGAIHPDELWRLDRARHLIVLHDWGYGNGTQSNFTDIFLGYSSLLGSNKPQSIEAISKILLGIMPSIITTLAVFVVVRLLFGRILGVFSTLLTLLSYNFQSLSRTFMSEPLHAMFISLSLLATVLISRKKRVILSALALLFMTFAVLVKPTVIILFPLLLAYHVKMYKSEPRYYHTLLKMISPSMLMGTWFYPRIFTYSTLKEVVLFIFKSGDKLSTVIYGLLTIVLTITFLVLLINRRVNALKLIYALSIIVILMGIVFLPGLEWFFHWINLLRNEISLFVLFIALLVITLKKSNTKSDWVDRFSTFLVALSLIGIFLTAALSKLLNDSFPRHIVPYIPILSVMAAVSINRLQKNKLMGRKMLIIIAITLTLLQIYHLLTHRNTRDTWEYYQDSGIKNYSLKLKNDIKLNDSKLLISFGNSDFWNDVNGFLLAYYYNDEFITLDYSPSGKRSHANTGWNVNVLSLPACMTRNEKYLIEYMSQDSIDYLLKFNCSKYSIEGEKNLLLDHRVDDMCVYRLPFINKAGKGLKDANNNTIVIEAESWEGIKGLVSGRDTRTYCRFGYVSKNKQIALRNTESTYYLIKPSNTGTYYLWLKTAVNPVSLTFNNSNVVVGGGLEYSWKKVLKEDLISNREYKVELKGIQDGYALIDQLIISNDPDFDPE